MHILLRDNHLLAVNKPAGLLSQDSGREEENLEDQARLWIAEEKNKPGAAYCHAVHRIDRNVTGVVLFATTSKALTRLQVSMRDGEIERTYQALVLDPPATDSGVLTDWLLHRNHFAEVVKKPIKGASKAVLHYRLAGRVGKRFCLEIKLETGRYHQIRAQLANAGMPLLGDKRYGGGPWHGAEGIGLHSHTLTFPHPIGGELTTVEAPLPSNWPRP